jgi:hypothetical protein
MANKSRSKTAEGNSSVYKTSRRWESNRKRKLAKVLKEQPNNEQVKLAMKSMVYRRRVPTNRMWPASWVRVAKLFKEFTGRFDPDIMSSNADIARVALQIAASPASTSKKKPLIQPMHEKVFFQLGSRLNMRKANA